MFWKEDDISILRGNKMELRTTERETNWISMLTILVTV